MKTMRHALIALVAFAAVLSPVLALDIPLTGVAAGGGGGATAVGFVDMERIFQVYPQTQVAKEDYTKQLQKRREQLAEKEAQVTNLKNRISILESTVKDMQAAAPADPTAAEPNPEAVAPSDLATMKGQLETQMAEYDELRKQAERDLATFQGRQSEIILGNIYEALRDLAQEEQLSVVVDKASILYGDTAIDLTEKLQAKVRGY